MCMQKNLLIALVKFVTFLLILLILVATFYVFFLIPNYQKCLEEGTNEGVCIHTWLIR